MSVGHNFPFSYSPPTADVSAHTHNRIDPGPKLKQGIPANGAKNVISVDPFWLSGKGYTAKKRKMRSKSNINKEQEEKERKRKYRDLPKHLQGRARQLKPDPKVRYF